MTARKHWCGNLDGVREALICAPTQKRAAELARSSVGMFRDYFSPTTDPRAAEITGGVEGVWVRSYRLQFTDPWAGWAAKVAK